MTTYEYDGSGRLIRSLTVAEPEFSDWDRAVLMADRLEESRPRGRHGLPMEVATDPNNQYSFSVGVPTMDFAQLALNRAQDRYRKQWPDADMDALVWRVDEVD